MAKLVSRFASEHADTFRFIPAFSGKTRTPQMYDTIMAYLKLVDPHFRLRSMIDPFENEPPWYDTVHMIAGFKQIEDGKLNITSLFMFQACIGEIEPSEETGPKPRDIVWFCLLDFFCYPGKHIPDTEDITLVLQIACSEVKCAGIENLIVLARSTISPVGERKRVPALFPYYTLKRFGFEQPSASADTIERLVLTQMQEASSWHLKDNHYPLRVMSIVYDESTKKVSRAVAVSSCDGKPLFVWDGMTLVWIEAQKELMAKREDQLIKSWVEPLDKQRHRTKVCFLSPCKGKVIKGGHITRHLRKFHKCKEDEVSRWQSIFKDSIRGLDYPDEMMDVLSQSAARSSLSMCILIYYSLFVG